MIKPYQVEISEETLQNIYTKVKNYSWHEMPDVGGWNYGTNLDYMKEFSKYWVETKTANVPFCSPHSRDIHFLCSIPLANTFAT